MLYCPKCRVLVTENLKLIKDDKGKLVRKEHYCETCKTLIYADDYKRKERRSN